MKECSRCFRCWDDSAEICSDDGAALAASLPGPRILDGKYRVDHRLGHGGMGIVYRAHHLALQKTFALKVMATVDALFLARFRTEAETLGRLKHPNIVEVTDFGIDPRGGGLPYLVMEYLEGSTLADRCRRFGTAPLEQSLSIFAAIADAIDHAHQRGILHLDLKPGNIFVCSNEPPRHAVKILDFGLARFVSDLSDADEGEVPRPTRVGADTSAHPEADEGGCPECGGEREVGQTGADQCPVCLLRLGLSRGTAWSEPRWIGTVGYMAPEILNGQAATRASDIYSLGILIYEVLVGRQPFQGSATAVIAGHRAAAAPPPAGVNTNLPGEFDDALLPALHKVPDHRPRCATDLVRQIRSAAFRGRVKAWRRREIPRRMALAVAAAAVPLLVSAPISRSRVLQQVESRSVDARFVAMPTRAPDPRLILVSLDEASLAADPTPLADKADEFGRELERVFQVGARGVAIDFLLPETWSRSQAFSELVLRHPEALTLAAFSSPGGIVIGPECLNALTAAALGPERVSDLFAFVNLDEDSDGVSRRARLSYLDDSGTARETWATRAVRSLEGSGVAGRESGRRFWIDYSVDWRRFRRVSWKDLAATVEREPHLFRDRLVLVGGDYVGFGGDYHRVPVAGDGSQGVSGLVLQALIANTILSRMPVREVASFPFLLGMGIALVALALAFLLSARWLAPAVLLVTLIPVFIVCSFVIFVRMQVLLPLVGPLLTVACASVLILALRAALPKFPEYGTEA